MVGVANDPGLFLLVRPAERFHLEVKVLYDPGRGIVSRTALSRSKNLTWEQISEVIVDDNTKLPPEIENQHKDE